MRGACGEWEHPEHHLSPASAQAQAVDRGAARCASLVLVRGAQAIIYLAGRGAQADARGATHVLDRGVQAVARGTTRCALHKWSKTNACGRSVAVSTQISKVCLSLRQNLGLVPRPMPAARRSYLILVPRPMPAAPLDVRRM